MSPVYTIPSFKVATVCPPAVIRLIELPFTSFTDVPAVIVAVEPSVPVKATEPVAPSTATEEPPVPLTVREPFVPLVPVLPKVTLSASFKSYVAVPVPVVDVSCKLLPV